jgi:ABC-type dipeptide/oligopeptide/nickel transport system permease subunit
MTTKKKGAIFLLAVLFICLGFLFLQNTNPFSQNLLHTLEGPSKNHILGTDHLGRDFAARLARGALNSICLSAFCVFGSVIIGLLLGSLAACGKEKTEKCLLVFTDVVMAFPGIVLAIVLSALTSGGPSAVIIALIFTEWPHYFRMVRSLLKGILVSPYVEAAKLAGFPLPILLLKYVFPKLIPTLGVMAALAWGKIVLEISSLGFLGIGVAPPEPELGAMISEGIAYMRTAPRVVFLPGGVICLFVFALLLIGNENSNKTGGPQL